MVQFNYIIVKGCCNVRDLLYGFLQELSFLLMKIFLINLLTKLLCICPQARDLMSTYQPSLARRYPLIQEWSCYIFMVDRG